MSLASCNTRVKERVINYEKEKFLQAKEQASYLAKLYRVLDQLKEDYYNMAENNNEGLIKKKYLKELIDRYQATIDEIKYVKKKEHKDKLEVSLEKIINKQDNYPNYKQNIKWYVAYYKNRKDKEEDFIKKKAYEKLYNIYKNFTR